MEGVSSPFTAPRTEVVLRFLRMSRFSNPLGATVAVPVSSRARPGAGSPVAPVALRTPVVVRSDQAGLVTVFGFIALCAYLLSGFANDLSLRFFGSKAYISSVCIVLLPVTALLSGRILSGSRNRVGLMWLGFLAAMVLSTPFSVWKGGSADLLVNYVPKGYLLFFYICAFVPSIDWCRRLMYVKMFGSLILLISCFFLYDPSAGQRFRIQDSLFFSNANDLALALLISITEFGFLIYQKGVKAVIGAAGSGVALVYMMKTESRGVFVAAIVVCLALLAVSRNRLKVLMLGLPLAIITLGFTSQANFRRLTLIVADPTNVVAENEDEGSTLASQAQRQELLKKSLLLTLRNPLLGVGPGMFAVAVEGDAAKQGKRSEWLGTHNSYTQVSSECGIPALLLYLGIILSCIGMNYRMYKRASSSPGNEQAAALCLCLFLGMIAYAAGTLFFHIAYSGTLPLLSGMSVCTYMAAQKLLPRDQNGSSVTP